MESLEEAQDRLVISYLCLPHIKKGSEGIRRVIICKHSKIALYKETELFINFTLAGACFEWSSQRLGLTYCKIKI